MNNMLISNITLIRWIAGLIKKILLYKMRSYYPESDGHGISKIKIQ